MKIREGFVSNSSSTSFLIYGAKVSSDDKPLKGGLDYYYGDPNCDHQIYVGRSLEQIGMDETKRQFQEDIEKNIREIFGEDTIISTYDESYYNG